MAGSVTLASPAANSSSPFTARPARNVAIDAYRGFVMVLMMAEVMELGRIWHTHPGNWFWAFLGFNQSHVEWAGCSLHDMIQPSFSFLVGVALPYSLASRLSKGAPFPKLLVHAMWRSFMLIALGIFLRSLHTPQTYFTFEDTLTQIGLGYTFLFLLGFAKARTQWLALGLILFGYWLAWALYPAGVAVDWSHNFSGFAAHWNKNSNFGNTFDQWFLNLFPREHPFRFNEGGYLTLSFIPTLGTMILGLIAGRWLKAAAPQIPFRRFLLTGSACIALSLVLHFTGICPIVKRIWTPAWTLFSGGICFYFVAAFSWVLDVKKKQGWAYPLVVVGMNSIAAYLIAHLCDDLVRHSLLTHLGAKPFQIFGTSLEPLLLGIAMLLVYWLMLWWMYRRKIFLKI